MLVCADDRMFPAKKNLTTWVTIFFIQYSVYISFQDVYFMSKSIKNSRMTRVYEIYWLFFNDNISKKFPYSVFCVWGVSCAFFSFHIDGK